MGEIRVTLTQNQAATIVDALTRRIEEARDAIEAIESGTICDGEEENPKRRESEKSRGGGRRRKAESEAPMDAVNEAPEEEEPVRVKHPTHKDGTPNRHGSAAGSKYAPPGCDLCGSKGWRHKAGCANTGGSSTKRARAADAKDAAQTGTKYECMFCGHEWKSEAEFDEEREKGCSECHEKMIVSR